MNQSSLILLLGLICNLFFSQSLFSSNSDSKDDDQYDFDRYHTAAQSTNRTQSYESLYTKVAPDTKSALNLCDLPVEILTDIFSYLSPFEVNSLRSISQTFNRFIQDSDEYLNKQFLTEYHFEDDNKDIKNEFKKYFKTCTELFRSSSLFNNEPFKSWRIKFFKAHIGADLARHYNFSKEINLIFNYLDFMKKTKFLSKVEHERMNRETSVRNKLGPPLKDKILRQFIDIEKIFHNNLINNTLIKLALIKDQDNILINSYWKFKLLCYKKKFNKAINYFVTINNNLDDDPEILYLRFKHNILEQNKKSTNYFQSLAHINFLQWKSKILPETFSINPNVQQAYMDLYIHGSRHKIAKAQYYLGQIYYYGSYKNFSIDIDLKRATEWYLEAAHNGHAKAQLMIANLYQNECKSLNALVKNKYKIDSQEDDRQSTNLKLDLIEKESEIIKWLRRSARQGLAKAQFTLGLKHKHGDCTFKDQNMAKRWFTLSAEQGFKEAQYELALIYESNKSILLHKNLPALWWFDQAAQQGHKDAQFKIEIAYNTKLAEQGDAEAKYKLGILYSRGDKLVQKNNFLAYEYLRSADNLGNLMASYELGTWYEKGYYVKQDIKKSLKIYNDLSAPKGNSKLAFLGALCKFAKLHKDGIYVSLDKHKSSKLYQEVDSIHNHIYSYYIGKALYQLSKEHDKSHAFKQNKLHNAAQHGYTKAQYIYLADRFSKNKNVKYSKDNEYDLFKKLYEEAENRNRKARYYLGRMYSDGTGIEQNHNIAAEWYLESARQGYAKAQFNLGEVYERGLGAEQDYKLAAKWYGRAAKQGHKDARSRLDALNDKGLIVNIASTKTKQKKSIVNNDDLKNYDF